MLALVLAVMLGAPAPSSAFWRTYPLGSASRPYTVGDMSCPTARLCVGIDFAARIVSSRNPTGPPRAWARSSPVEALPAAVYTAGISCSPGGGVCVSFDTAGNALASTDPTGGAGAWTVTPAPFQPAGASPVSCGASSLCAAVDGRDQIATSTAPGAGGAWKVVALGQGLHLTAISCPSVNLCVALDQNTAQGTGHVVTSADPAGDAGTWQVAPLSPGLFFGFNLVGLSCPTTRFCAAVDSAGELLTSTDPAGGAGAWRLTSIYGPLEGGMVFQVFECPSSRLCLAGDRYGNLDSSIDPTAGPRAWTGTLLKPQDVNLRLGSDAPGPISCPSARFCLVVQGDSVQISTHPTALAERAARPAFSRATLRGIARGKPTLAFTLRAGIILPGRAISSIGVRLPRGIAYTTRRGVLAGLTVTGPRNARLRYSLRLSAGKLTFTLARPAARVRVAIGSGALLVDQALSRLVANRKGKSLTLQVQTVDAGRTSVTQKLKERAS